MGMRVRVCGCVGMHVSERCMGMCVIEGYVWVHMSMWGVRVGCWDMNMRG